MTRKVYHNDQLFRWLIFWIAIMALISQAIFLSLIFKSSADTIYKKITKNFDQSGLLHFYALNIGQGDALYFELPNGTSMLIDSGNADKKVIEELSKIKNIFDKKIDIALITHADADHIGSMQSVVEKFNPKLFLHSGVSGRSVMYKKLMQYVDRENISAGIPQNVSLYDGMIIHFKNLNKAIESKHEVNETKLEILHPNFLPRIDKYISCTKLAKKSAHAKAIKTKMKKCDKILQFETNEYSVVARLVYGSTSIMLTGDANFESEADIISSHPFDELTSTILKVGHHGSKTSTSENFLKLVRPEFAIISVGEHNRYGHPSRDTLDRFGAAQQVINILRTDKENTIHMVLDGISVSLP